MDMGILSTELSELKRMAILLMPLAIVFVKVALVGVIS